LFRDTVKRKNGELQYLLNKLRQEIMKRLHFTRLGVFFFWQFVLPFRFATSSSLGERDLRVTRGEAFDGRVTDLFRGKLDYVDWERRGKE
jgi:hypothetical protein